MKFTKIHQKEKTTMKIKINNNINYTLNKISFLQIFFLGTISLFYFFYKEYAIFSGFLISGITLFSFIQLVKLSSQNKFMSLFGFPIRLIVIGLLCAILVHKLHPNLIALFIGFAFSLLIYILIMFQYAESEIRNQRSVVREEKGN